MVTVLISLVLTSLREKFHSNLSPSIDIKLNRDFNKISEKNSNENLLGMKDQKERQKDMYF